MKLRSISYLSKEGVKNMWANRLMTIASVGVLMACMVLIGLAILVSLNLNSALSNLEQQNVVRVFFNDKISVMYGESSKDHSSATDSSDTSSSADTTEDTTASSGEASSDTDSSAQSDTSSSVSGLDALSDPDSVPDSAYAIHNEKEAKELCDTLSEIDNVLSVKYISSEDALNTYQETGGLPEEYIEYFQFEDEYGNPLSCGAEITLEDMGKFDETVTAIQSTHGVDSVLSYAELAQKIEAIKEGIGIAGIWIIAILLIISLVIVSNTIRVTMYSRKLEIGIMKAVGATNSFIRLPFVIEGVMIGLISALLSMGVVYFCYRVAIEAIAEAIAGMVPISFLSVSPIIFGVFAAIGIVAGVLGSLIMIGKYLKKEGSEFTAI